MLSYRKSPVFFVQNGQTRYYEKGDEIQVFDQSNTRYSVTVHGAGWVHNKLVFQSSQLSGISIEVMLNPEFGASQKGVICTSIFSPKYSLIFPDPLGSNILFFYKQQEIFACSTDLEELVKVLKHNGVELKKNLFFLAETVCTGSGGFFDSSYEDIQALEPHSYIQVKDNTVTVLKYHTESIIFDIPEFEIDDIKNDIAANIRAVGEHKDLLKVAHITGGFDSRLVFSALMSSNLSVEDNLYFLCNGNSRLTDKSIATKLCSAFGQTMINNAGIIANPNYVDNLLKHTSGMSLQHPPIAKMRNELIMAGGFGENLRSFYSQALQDELETHPPVSRIVEKLYGNVLSEEKSKRFVSDEFYEQFIKRFTKKLHIGLNNGLDAAASIDYLYVSVRNRYFLSQTAIHYSNISPRVDPLYSVYGAGYALHMDSKRRQTNMLGLELMYRFDPECLALPFDRQRITQDFMEEHPAFQQKNFTSGSAKVLNLPIASMRADVNSSTKIANQDDIKKANELGSPLWQIANLSDVQKKLKHLISQLDSKELSNNFDAKYISYLSSAQLNNRVHIRRLFNIFNILSWYYED